jgi:hypothetical protein
VSWNYRLVRTYHLSPSGETEETIAIHEVYYDKKGKPNGYTENPSWPQGETWEEFQKDFDHYQKATLSYKNGILDARSDFGVQP